MPVDLLCLGEAMVEFNQREAGGFYVQGFGGDTSNAAICAARQGASSGYLSAVGDDAFGKMLIGLWETEGVSVEHVGRKADTPTGVYFVTHGPEGHEFTYRRAGSAASLMRPADLPVEALRTVKILHLSAISQAISVTACDTAFEAVKIVSEAGGLVSYDTNLRLSLWPLERARAVIHATVGLSDILLPGLDDARLLTGLEEPREIADFYLAMGAKIVALTLGGEGALIATPERTEAIAPYRVDLVDATGAGDAFDGAFLSEYLATGDPFRAGRYANAAAALSVRGLGAVAPQPTRAEVEAFIRGD
ncbi:sugar kinase [Rhizobiales bacterium]|uniref:sugar kinase n=1 Tax=Hongsoonwoonella zoysiae TaxID=2821844 RepID=UPI001560D1E1|nr:sugar kinase [Hongsoonwoonella zoysiae]NRG17172.1 sugar kinase [Hongsoonwoonella zoysiae]